MHVPYRPYAMRCNSGCLWVYCTCSYIDLHVAGPNCPDSCMCTANSLTGNTKVDCENKGLLKMPVSLPGDTEILLLSDNENIKQISDHAFSGCAMLCHLDLSRNCLSYIGKDAFTGIDQLRILLLNNNCLHVYSLLPMAFSNLNLLEELAIQGNSLYANMEYNDQLFANLQNLKKLSMDGLPKAAFGQGFSYLNSLQSLHIYWKTTSHISNNTFEMLNKSDVREIVVRNNGVTNIEPLAFAHFTHLETLDLSYSRMAGFPNECTCWYGLQYTNISTLLLTSSANTDVEFFDLDVSFYKYLELTRLKKLVVDANNIMNFVAYAVYTSHLEHLSLASNCLVRASDVVTAYLFPLQRLLTVNLSFQYPVRRSFDTEVQGQKTASLGNELYWKNGNREKKIRMRRVGLRYLPSDRPVNGTSLRDAAKVSDNQTPIHGSRIIGNTLLWEYIHRKKIKEDGNALVSQEMNGILDKWQDDRPKTPLPCSPRLEELNMAGALRGGYDSLTELYFASCKNMRMLNASWNYLEKIEGPLGFIEEPPERLTLDLSVNNLIWIDLRFGVYVGSFLDKLILANNNLGKQLTDKTTGNPFSTLKNLIEMDLSRNSIKGLPSNFFIHQLKMERIDLSQNAMHSINFKFTHMKNLTTLDLSGNLLDQLDRQTRMAIANVSNMRVDLTDNPLLCSCLTLDFLEWLREESSHLKNWKEYDCTLGEQRVNLSNLENLILPTLQKECTSKEWVIGSSVVLIGVIILLAVSFVLYRHRFDIRYLCLKLIIKRREHQALEERDVFYDYDAFVAFDQQDRNWIDYHLIPRLDSQDGGGNYKLLVHHRDFHPGINIKENILRGIQSSRKIILILTRHFVESNWCRFELEMSRMRCFDEGKDLIVAILLEEDIPSLQLSRTLRALLNRNTYLLWPENPREMETFWISLNNALEATPENIMRCRCGQTMKVWLLIVSKTLHSLRRDSRVNVYGAERNASDCSAPRGTRGITMNVVWHRQQNTCQRADLRVFPSLLNKLRQHCQQVW